MFIIHKSHSKNDLIDLINLLMLPVVFSHSDNKKTIHEKLDSLLKTNFEIKKNYYNIENKDGLKVFLSNKNPKKNLTIKEKQEVMSIAKFIINYCKSGYNLDASIKYNSYQEIKDDMDYIKQFGDIPSVRRCCKLLSDDINMKEVFKPLISPQVQKELEDKSFSKVQHLKILKIRYSTPDNPVIVHFD